MERSLSASSSVPLKPATVEASLPPSANGASTKAEIKRSALTSVSRLPVRAFLVRLFDCFPPVSIWQNSVGSHFRYHFR